MWARKFTTFKGKLLNQGECERSKNRCECSTLVSSLLAWTRPIYHLDTTVQLHKQWESPGTELTVVSIETGPHKFKILGHFIYNSPKTAHTMLYYLKDRENVTL